MEQVEFLDDLTVRRRVSVDFELPSNEPNRVIANRAMDLVPLALLQKAPLVGFDLRDESGASIPLLTRQQNAFVSWSLLAAVGEVAARLGGFPLPLPAEVLTDLHRITFERPELAAQALRRFVKPGRRATKSLRRALMRDEVFATLADALVANFLLLVLVEHNPSQRRVMKFSYIEPLPWPPLSWSLKEWKRLNWMIRIRLGWEPVPLDFAVPSLNEAGAFHFEVAAPRGLVVQSAEVVEDETGYVVTEVSGPAGPKVHLYVPTEEYWDLSSAWVWLQPNLPGLIRASYLFALGVAMLLLALAVRGPTVPENPASTLLLAVPGFVGLFIARPGEHLLTSRALLGFRGVVAVLGLLPFAGAAGLVLGAKGTSERVMWWVLAGMALGLTSIIRKTRSAAKDVTYGAG
ncbi:MAG TPA: hypothetical protein VHI71_12100 [Actinomycetota bacterium]|nr:hypothetical protein [Actinomycetota bacterium]